MPSAAPAAPAPYYPPVRRAAGQGPGLVRDWRQEGRSHKVGQGLRTKADRMQRHRGGEHREQLTGAQAAGCGGHADRSSPLRSVFRAWHAWAPCVRCCPDPSAAHARVRSHLVHVRMPRAGAHGTRHLGQMGRNFVKLGIRIRGALWRRRRAESICCEGVMRLSLID